LAFLRLSPGYHPLPLCKFFLSVRAPWRVRLVSPWRVYARLSRPISRANVTLSSLRAGRFPIARTQIADSKDPTWLWEECLQLDCFRDFPQLQAQTNSVAS